MHPEEIKIECERAYAKIESAKDRLIELRKICKHEKTSKRAYSWRPGSITEIDICDYCNQVVQTPHLVTVTD